MNGTQVGLNEPQNTLLGLLPDNSRTALPPLEDVTLDVGTVLQDADRKIDYWYFPVDALVSILSLGPDGSTIEVGLVGRDGMIGVSALLGGVSPYRAVVQSSGSAFRMKCGRINEGAYDQNKAFQTLLLSYTNAFITQVTQSTLCNCYHSLQERICRWLMFARHAARTNTLRVTHETISRLLRSRRASVTSTLGLLQRAGLIRMSRGKITILDARGLEGMCCECYLILKDGARQLNVQ
jgi:CRP-like cAMP-binding protein